MNILGIETSGNLCSVAWQKDDALLLEYNHNFPNNHSEILADLINQGLKKLSLKPEDINLVAIASGPGSFTGLRIGMAYSKGFCYALKNSIISVSNFEVLASQVKEHKFPIHTLIDANRGKVYEGVFTTDKFKIDEMSVKNCIQLGESYPTEGSIIINNFEVIKDLKLNKKINILPGKFAASYICEIGYKKFLMGKRDELDSIEPLYIQNFAGVA